MQPTRVKLLTVLLALIVLLAACGTGQQAPAPAPGESGGQNAAPVSEAPPVSSDVRIGLVVGTGGLGDQNFNDMAYFGLREAEAAFGISFDYSEPQSNADFEPHLTLFAETGLYDLIIVSSSMAQTAVESVAAQFPEQQFSIVDAQVDAPNVRSILKDFADMTFLNGFVAGLMTTDTSIPNINEQAMIGMILGLDIPNMQSGARGFTAGATLANPDIDVRIGIVGAFNDPATAQEIVRSMYDEGADIVLNFAGGSGLGLLNEARERNLFAMGGARNQNPDEPDFVIASAIENLQEKVFMEVQEIVEGRWTPGPDIGNLQNGYVGITFEGSNVNVPANIIAQMELLRDMVVAGEIVLPETFEEIPAWAAATAPLLEQ